MEFTGERMIPEISKEKEIYLEHFSRYLFACQFVKKKKVLDIACGEGYGADLLARSEAKKVFGVDISEKVISHAKKKYLDSKLDFIVGDITKIPLPDDFFDIVISFETIEHVGEEEQKIFLKEIDRVLKSGGILIMSTPNGDKSDGKNPFHQKELSLKEYLYNIEKKFKNTEVFYQENVISNYILQKDAMKKRMKSSDINTNYSNLIDQDPKKSAFFVSVSSNEELPSIENQMTIFNSSERNELIYYIRDMEKIIGEKDEIYKKCENMVLQMDKEIHKLNNDLKLSTEKIQKIKRKGLIRLIKWYYLN